MMQQIDGIQFASNESQDVFIYYLMGNQKQGTFLDIACGPPIGGNNTYSLEQLGWNGWCFDIGDVEKTHQWSFHRKASFTRLDATSELLSRFLFPITQEIGTIDYLSVDVDSYNHNYSWPTLCRIINGGIRFKVMTFEHEAYLHGPAIQSHSRALLEALGYVRLFSDMCIVTGSNSEDWWIDSRYFNENVWKIQGENLVHTDIIKRMEPLKFQFLK